MICLGDLVSVLGDGPYRASYGLIWWLVVDVFIELIIQVQEASGQGLWATLCPRLATSGYSGLFCCNTWLSRYLTNPEMS